MKRLNNEQINIIDNIDSSNNINQYLNIKIDNENNLEKKATKINNKKINNDIFQTIKKKQV